MSGMQLCLFLETLVRTKQNRSQHVFTVSHVFQKPRISSGIRSPADPKGTVFRYPYLATDRKHFLKAPLAPIYTNFEGGVRAKKTGSF